MSEPANHYDVIIVGAGMVGATLACRLAGSGMQVAIVDASQPAMSWAEEGYDIRVSAITRASQQIFAAEGIWPYMLQERVTPYRDMHVWDAGGSGAIHFDSAEIGEAELGHIIENRVIVRAAHQRMAELDNISLFAPVKGQSIDYQQEQAILTLEDGTELHARLIIAADGGRSWVRQQAGIAVKGWDYDQVALVTWVRTGQSHRATAWQRFLTTGPLAFLPLPDEVSSIVWSNSADEVKRLLALDEKAFATELAEAFQHTLGDVTEVGPRAAFPLRTFETMHYVQPRLALVGDAAHTIHPLAGQGVNLGLADADSLAQVILDAVHEKKDIGSMKVLRRYERWRRADNRTMLLSMDGFKRLFSTDQPVLRWLRNTGLSVTDRLGPVKHMIMRQAMGIKK